MKAINLQRVLKQLKADLIGKDSYRGVTLTYSWMANQFGHFSLGFIPSFVLYHFIQNNPKYSNPIWSSLFVSITWLLFELYNFLGPLLTKKSSKTKVIYVQKKQKYVFTPQWANVAYDTFTDLCFFWLGAFTFSLLIAPSTLVIVILVTLLLIILYASRYWFLTKMYQMYAKYPFQMRLSQWNFSMTDKDKKCIENYLKPSNKQQHLLIFGAQKCGKTSLGVAIANEFSIKHETCLYTSAIKLYSSFFKDDLIDNQHEIWSWKNTCCLIIDDVNPGEPISEELVDAKKFLRFVDAFATKINKENRAILKNKKVIWVLGNKKATSKHQNPWKEMLLKIGVAEQEIKQVTLQKTVL